MTVNVVQLLIALALLWCPRQFLRVGVRIGSQHRRRKFDRQSNERGPQDSSVSLQHELKKLRNYIDYGRAALGGAVIFGTTYTDACIRVVSGAPTGSGRLVLGLQVLIVLIGMLIQLVRLEPRLKLFASIFYLMGLALGLCGLKVGGFATVMIWAINIAGLPPAGFLFLYGATLLAFASVFNGGRLLSVDNRNAIIAAVIVAAPALISWMAREKLVHFIKRSKSAEEFSQA